MNTALVISLMAVAISLFTVFIALRAATAKKAAESGSDSGGYSYADGTTIGAPVWTPDSGAPTFNEDRCETSASGDWSDSSSGSDGGSCDSGGSDGGGGSGGD